MGEITSQLTCIKRDLEVLNSISIKKLRKCDAYGKTFSLEIRYTILNKPFIKAISYGSVKTFECSKRGLQMAKQWILKAWEPCNVKEIEYEVIS